LAQSGGLRQAQSINPGQILVQVLTPEIQGQAEIGRGQPGGRPFGLEKQHHGMVVARGPGPGPGAAGKGGFQGEPAAGVRVRKEVHGEDGAGEGL